MSTPQNRDSAEGAAKPRRLRILCFAPHFAEYASRLSAALSRDADVLLICERRNLDLECAGLDLTPPSPALAVATFAAKYAHRTVSVRRLMEFRRICGHIDSFQPDVIHVQEQGDRFTVAILRRYAARCAIVVTVHDPKPHVGSDAAIARRYARGLAAIREMASAYHVHGAYCEAVLRRETATRKPVVATLHGTILEPAAGSAGSHERRFLFFGRMEAYKGLATLLDAIDLLPPGHGLRFVFAGRGPELERFRGRILANPAIELVEKFLTPQEAISEFQRARAVVVPYDEATQSGVVSAAFGNGRPVIASRVGGLVDGVRHGESGLLVPPSDPAALAEAILSLADDALAHSLAAGARAAAAGGFAWPTVVAPLLQLYARLGAERARA